MGCWLRLRHNNGSGASRDQDWAPANYKLMFLASSDNSLKTHIPEAWQAKAHTGTGI